VISCSRMMKILAKVIFIAALMTLTQILLLEGNLGAASESDLLAVGQEVAVRRCSGCHAIGLNDVSQDPHAPLFRTLGKKYPIDSLQEALAEGIVTGHSDMPEFRFDPRDVDALIIYLQSIQQK
jgi:cytochrome c